MKARVDAGTDVAMIGAWDLDRGSGPTATDRATLIRRYDYGDSALFLYGPATQDRSAS